MLRVWWILGLACWVGGAQASYESHPKAQDFVASMAVEGFAAESIQQLLSEAERQESVLNAISRPAERRLTWGEYRKIFLGEERIRQGVEFWAQHREVLTRASEQFGVAPEIIVAIIGVETRYGRNKGSYRVLDALVTLAFDYPPRSTFFTRQLRELLILAREEHIPAQSLKGSYAGAMGYGQFIPSSYRHFAVDFDADGQRDIWDNPVDAIGSVANYFAEHGWKQGQPVVTKAEVADGVSAELFNAGLKPSKSLAEWRALGVTGDTTLAEDLSAMAMLLETEEGIEHWLGLENFYVITRYNHSHLYAMAVYQLSQAILAARQAED